jgi:hypothetical protein
MIPHAEITPGYYWATHGPYPAAIVRVNWQIKPEFIGKKVGKYVKGGAVRPPESYQDLKVTFHGTLDRSNIEGFVFHERIEQASYQHSLYSVSSAE